MPVCLRVASTAKISDLLKDAPGGVETRALARSSNIDADRLGRVMRLLATSHVYTEGEHFLSVTLAGSDGYVPQ